MNNLLLIDNRVSSIEIITNSLNSITKYIIFDYNIDNIDSIKNKITNLKLSSIDSIAILQHNYNQILYQFTINNVYDFYNYQTWEPFLNFIIYLKNNYNINNFDMIACSLYSDPKWKNILDNLQSDSNVNIRSSTDLTGSGNLNGNWFLESDNINLKDVYFTNNIDNYNEILYTHNVFYLNNYKMFRTKTPPCNLLAVGDSTTGGDISSVLSNVRSGVVQVVTNSYAHAALKTNGAVYPWGNSLYGGSNNTSAAISSNVVEVYSTTAAFAALKSDGSVVAWGSSAHGGSLGGIVSSVSSNVINIFSTNSAFAALKSDGSVIVWGDSANGGSNNTSAAISSGVIYIYSNINAFAALKNDGSVVCWGNSAYGGNGSVASGVVMVYVTENAFAALKNDGSVVVWGDSTGGGSNNTNASISSGVIHIMGTQYSFAALKNDGTVALWGNTSMGGSNDTGVTLTNIKGIYNAAFMFGAIKNDGSFVAWGNTVDALPTTYAHNNYLSIASSLTSNVMDCYMDGYSFACLKNDGSLILLGRDVTGGVNNTGATLTNILAIYNGGGFASIKTNTSSEIWGAYTNNTGADIASGVIMTSGRWGGHAISKSNGLHVHFPFENSSNETLNNATVTITGSISYVAGKVGSNAIYFNNYVVSGTAPTNYISISNNNYMNNMTIAFWYNYDNNTSNQTIMGLSSNSNNPCLQIDFTNGILYVFGAFPSNSPWTIPGITNNVSYAINTWHHIAVSINAATYQVTLYVNGSFAASGTGTGLPSNTSTYERWVFGGSSDMARGYKGYIDDLRIYRRVLTPYEVSRLYNLDTNIPNNDYSSLTNYDKYYMAKKVENRRIIKDLYSSIHNKIIINNQYQLQRINYLLPQDEYTLLLPPYTNLNTTPTVVIPSTPINKNYIICCDIGESIIIDGVTYVNFNLSVYSKSGANYTKVENVTINSNKYYVFGCVNGGIILKYYKGILLGPSVDLTNQDITYANLNAIDLTGSNLTTTNISNISINSLTNLSSTILTGVKSGNIIGSTPNLPSNYKIV